METIEYKGYDIEVSHTNKYLYMAQIKKNGVTCDSMGGFSTTATAIASAKNMIDIYGEELFNKPKTKNS